MVHARGLVVLTRASTDNAALRARLQAAGFDVAELPTAAVVMLEPPPDLTTWNRQRARADGVALTSRHAVVGWLRWQSDTGPSAACDREAGSQGATRDPSGHRPLVGCVGAATAAAARAAGLQVDVVASEPGAASALALALLDAIEARARRLSRPCSRVVLWPRGRDARPELRAALVARGCEVEEVIVYANTEPVAPAAADVLRCAGAAAVLVAAPSACARLLAWAPQLADRRFVAIGHTTAAALRDRHGIEPAAIAAAPTDDACFEALVAAVAAPVARPA
ncbi:MAG: hypothetical protein EXR79_12860 [Myxococcales bacterium]|nr:hypothetical protein [Myxococcales bacterium]